MAEAESQSNDQEVLDIFPSIRAYIDKRRTTILVDLCSQFYLPYHRKGKCGPIQIMYSKKDYISFKYLSEIVLLPITT